MGVSSIPGYVSPVVQTIAFYHTHSAQPVVAEVSPGDMLVVPPFWFHHVETLEESVSVNVWSDAPEYSIINKVLVNSVYFTHTLGRCLIKAKTDK